MKKIGFITQVIALFASLPLLIVLHINMGVKDNRQQDNIEQESANTTTATIFIAQFASAKETVKNKTTKMKRTTLRKASKKALLTCRLAETDIFEHSLFRVKPTNRLKLKTLCFDKGLLQKEMPSTIMSELMRPTADVEPPSQTADNNAVATTNNLPEKEWLITPMLL